MEKKNNEKLKAWLGTTPVSEYQNTLQKLAEYCGVSVTVVHFWKSGRTKIKPAYQKLINEFAGKKIFKD